MRITTYKLKLKPTASQAAKLEHWLGVCRLIYNLALDTRIQAYQKKKLSVSKSALQLQVKELASEYDWIKGIHSQVLQDPLVRLDISYRSFFRGEGFPKFAKKGKYKSFTFPQGVTLKGDKLSLPKFGLIGFHKGKRDLSDIAIKQSKIIKAPNGWFISITGEVGTYHLEKNDRNIGLDFGVANYIVTSDGEFVANPQIKKSFSKRVQLRQRSISRKKKGSTRRSKEIIILRKLLAKEAATRNDFQHKLSTRLISENQAISIEDLRFANMTKSGKNKRGLNRSLMDVAGGSFFTKLEYKSKWYGRTLVKVNPRNTSRECSSCGYTDKDNRKSQSVFVCLNCGHEKHADLNAAINILGRAFPSGDTNSVTGGPEKLHMESVTNTQDEVLTKQ